MAPSERPGKMILQEHVGALVSTGEEKFLGTAFPINQEERLYLVASHTIPTDDYRGLSIMIRLEAKLQMTSVEQIEELPGQPDVVVLRAADAAPHLLRLADSEAVLWEDVHAAGFPSHDIREIEPGKREIGLRALKGSVTRTVEVGETSVVRGPAYEVSFAIPSGMSGGPVYLFEPFPRYGLVGVCLANYESQSTLWHEERDEGEGKRTLLQGHRVIEYGLVALLHRSLQEPIPMAGASLEQLAGYEAHPQ